MHIKSTALLLVFFIAITTLAIADEAVLKKAEEYFKQRANTVTYGSAMFDFEQYYSRNKPDAQQAIFLARAYYYFGERYGSANPKKAVSIYNLGAKWASYSDDLDKNNPTAVFYYALCRLRSGSLKTQVKAVESIKIARQAFEKLTQKYPENPLAYLALGNLYREAPDWPVGYRDYDKSEELLAKAYSLTPADPEVVLEYAKTLIANKKYSLARNLLVTVSGMEGHPDYQVETDIVKKDALKEMTKIRGKF